MKIFKGSTWSIVVLALLLVLGGCAQSPSAQQPEKAAQPEPKDLPIPPEFKDSTEKEFALGKLLKTYDDVAWIGTDAVLASGYKPQDPATTGYVVEPTTDDLNGVYQFAFVTETDGKLRVAAVAHVDHHAPGMGKVMDAGVLNPAPEASDDDARIYAALKAAEHAPGLELCKASYNHVVLPYREDGKVEYRVYFLMSTTTNGVVPIGGHVLVRVADDAKTILEVKPLAKSCGMQPGADDKRVVALEFINLALDSPSAAQVFLMLRYEKPVYVMTKNGFLWGIDSKGIGLLSIETPQKTPGSN